MLYRLLILIILSGIFTACSSYMASGQTVIDTTTDSKSKVDSTGRTIVISPPPSAISPSVSGNSVDLCTVGVTGAIQTQLLGLSQGETITDQNCERLKISKTLYDMGMKVAAVSVLCQDRRVYDGMEMAGTPCPYFGQIGAEATKQWNTKAGKRKIPKRVIPETKQDVQKRHKEANTKVLSGAGLLLLLLAAL